MPDNNSHSTRQPRFYFDGSWHVQFFEELVSLSALINQFNNSIDNHEGNLERPTNRPLQVRLFRKIQEWSEGTCLKNFRRDFEPADFHEILPTEGHFFCFKQSTFEEDEKSLLRDACDAYTCTQELIRGVRSQSGYDCVTSSVMCGTKCREAIKIICDRAVYQAQALPNIAQHVEQRKTLTQGEELTTLITRFNDCDKIRGVLTLEKIAGLFLDAQEFSFDNLPVRLPSNTKRDHFWYLLRRHKLGTDLIREVWNTLLSAELRERLGDCDSVDDEDTGKAVIRTAINRHTRKLKKNGIDI